MPHLVTGHKTSDIAGDHYPMGNLGFRLASFEPCEKGEKLDFWQADFSYFFQRGL